MSARDFLCVVLLLFMAQLCALASAHLSSVHRERVHRWRIERLVKNVHKDLLNEELHGANVTLAISNNRADFYRVNAAVGGGLGDMLATVFDLKLMELKDSIKHARRMRGIMAKLARDNDA
jgi:hypothetical protein